MSGLLDVRGLEAFYGPIRALHGIDLSVDEGGVSAVLGANGAGKTTLLRAISGLLRSAGRIRFAGRRIDGLATERVARAGIAHLPEGGGNFPRLSVEENLQLGAILRRDRHAIGADRARMFEYFPVLAERRRQPAGTLSGGEQQMLALARALLSRPRLLLLDEPSFGLAPRVLRDLFELLGRVRREEGIALLLVEQNAALALRLAGRAYLLETGRVARTGTAQALRRDPAVHRIYLGLEARKKGF